MGKRNLCARFVPHFLTPEQREDRVTSCQDIIAMADADKNIFNNIITGDETWCFTDNPETKRQSSEWLGETSTWPKKLKFQRHRIKTTMIIYPNFRVPICFYCINHLEPTGHVMHHQFNIQQLYALPTLYLCVLYLSENKQRLVPLTA